MLKSDSDSPLGPKEEKPETLASFASPTQTLGLSWSRPGDVPSGSDELMNCCPQEAVQASPGESCAASQSATDKIQSLSEFVGRNRELRVQDKTDAATTLFATPVTARTEARLISSY